LPQTGPRARVDAPIGTRLQTTVEDNKRRFVTYGIVAALVITTINVALALVL
jgi:hypothetical protein